MPLKINFMEHIFIKTLIAIFTLLSVVFFIMAFMCDGTAFAFALGTLFCALILAYANETEKY